MDTRSRRDGLGAFVYVMGFGVGKHVVLQKNDTLASESREMLSATTTIPKIPETELATKRGCPRRKSRSNPSVTQFEPLTGNLTTEKSRDPLHYQLVEATNRMQAFELVQRQNEMAQMRTLMAEKDRITADRENMTALLKNRLSEAGQRRDVIAIDEVSQW